MKILNREDVASNRGLVKVTTKASARWGWTDWLLVATSAGLCFAAWRLVNDVRGLQDANDSDIRNLRDEYARLERERADLQRQLASLTERLTSLEAAPAQEAALTHALPPALFAPSSSVEGTPVEGTSDAALSTPISPDAVAQDTLASNLGSDAAVNLAKPPRAPRRSRSASPEADSTGGSAPPPQAPARKPRPRKAPPQPEGPQDEPQ